MRIESWSAASCGAVEQLAGSIRAVYPGLPNASWVALPAGQR
jgi:hypothetical protein